jgi:ABC-2 type transport system ATP-binding protein
MKEPSAKPFEGLPYVRKAEVKGQDVFLTVEHAGRHLPEILGRATGVEQVEMRTPTLNDVFIAITGREMREESEEEGGFMADFQAATRGT